MIPIAIAGPTASGKSALALGLCRALDGEIVSLDSMQIYRTLDIGTAKPTTAERAEVPHHLIDICEPTDKFSAADFTAAANDAVSDILSRGKTPVLCGGTGLYLDSFLRRRDYGDVAVDENLRRELFAFAEQNGNAALHGMLKALDPNAAEAIHENNVKRVVRAIEICKTTGMTKTEWDKAADSAPRDDVFLIVLDFDDREKLYSKIERRVDKMIEDGLVDEARSALETGALNTGTTASQAIGYKELIPYLRGECSLNDAVEQLKAATRHYAKRQLTWFRRYGGCRLYVDRYESSGELLSAALDAIKEGGK